MRNVLASQTQRILVILTRRCFFLLTFLRSVEHFQLYLNCGRSTLSYIINWREGSNMASEKKVKPKTWRILAKNDARSTPFGPVLSWYLPLTRLNSEPTSEFHTPLFFFVKNLKVFLFLQCFCCHIRINMARSFIYFRSLTISGAFYSAMGELKRSRVREMFKNNF